MPTQKIEVDIEVPVGWRVKEVKDYYKPQYERELCIRNFTEPPKGIGACYATFLLELDPFNAIRSLVDELERNNHYRTLAAAARAELARLEAKGEPSP